MNLVLSKMESFWKKIICKNVWCRSQAKIKKKMGKTFCAIKEKLRKHINFYVLRRF